MKLETRVNGRFYGSAEAGVKELQAINKRRVSALQDLGSPLAQVAVLFDRWVKKNFSSEGDNAGGWQPFKYGGRMMPDGTIDTSAKLLQDTGRLRASFMPFHTDKTAGIGSDLPYAQPQNATRRILMVRDDVIEQVKRIFEFHVKRSASIK